MANGEPVFYSSGFVQPLITTSVNGTLTLPNGERKPPIGVTPRYIHREQRQTELLRAISEYVAGGFVDERNRAIVLEWIDELREMVSEAE